MATKNTRRTKNAGKKTPTATTKGEYQIKLVLDGKTLKVSGPTLYDAIVQLKPEHMKNTSKGTLVMRHGEKTLERLIFAKQMKRLFGLKDFHRRMLVKIYDQSLR